MLSDISRHPMARCVSDCIFLNKYLSKSSAYMEWGFGFSTLLAIYSDVAKIYSIESNDKYLRKGIEGKPYNIVIKSERLIPISIGADFPVNKVGLPKNKDDESLKRWDSYIKAYHLLDEVERENIDLILVDGRSRISVLLYLTQVINKNVTVLVHDMLHIDRYYWKFQGEKLCSIYEYYDCIDSNYKSIDWDWRILNLEFYKKIGINKLQIESFSKCLFGEDDYSKGMAAFNLKKRCDNQELFDSVKLDFR